MLAKKLIIVNHIGTSVIETINSELIPFLNVITDNFDDVDARLAFSSNRAINKLAKRDFVMDTIDQSVYKGIKEGYKQIGILPLHVVGGVDFELTLDYVKGCNEKIKNSNTSEFDDIQLTLYSPLLQNKEDCILLAKALLKIIDPVESLKPIFFVCHGSSSTSNDLYQLLKDVLKELGLNAKMISLHKEIEEEVLDLDLDSLSECVLFPLFVVSGHHVMKDVFDEESGLIVHFKKRGIDVKAYHGGLIHYKEIQQIYLNKLR